MLYIWASLSVLTFLVALLAPFLLKQLNIVWNKFGLLLHKIMTPIIMGVMFFLVFLPLGLVLRLFKKLSLKKAFDLSLNTYWVERTPRGPLPETMKNSY